MNVELDFVSIKIHSSALDIGTAECNVMKCTLTE